MLYRPLGMITATAPSLCILLACSGVVSPTGSEGPPAPAEVVANFIGSPTASPTSRTTAETEEAVRLLASHCTDTGVRAADVLSYDGHFSGQHDDEVLHLVNCGDHRFPSMGWVLFAGSESLASGRAELGPLVHAIVDYDGDGRDEVIMAGGGTWQGITVSAAGAHRFGPDGVEEVQDFGIVYESPAPSEDDSCIERAAVIRWKDGALARSEFTAPCGGSDWVEQGDAPVYRAP